MVSFRSAELGEGKYFVVEDGLVKKTTSSEAKSPISFVAHTALETQGTREKAQEIPSEKRLSFHDWVQIKQGFDNRFKNLNPIMRGIGTFFEKVLDVFRSSSVLRKVFSLRMSSQDIEDGLRAKIKELDPESIIGNQFLHVETEGVGAVSHAYKRQERSRVDDVVTYVVNATNLEKLSFADVLQMERILQTKKGTERSGENPVRAASVALQDRKHSLLEKAYEKPAQGPDPLDDILRGYFINHPVIQSLSRRNREHIIAFVKSRIESETGLRKSILAQLKGGYSQDLNSLMMSCMRQDKKMQKALVDGAMGLVLASVGDAESVPEDLVPLVQFLQRGTYAPGELARQLSRSSYRLNSLREKTSRTLQEEVELSLLHLIENKAMYHARKIAPKTVVSQGMWFWRRFKHEEVSVKKTVVALGLSNTHAAFQDLCKSKVTSGASIPLARAGITHHILRTDKKNSYLVAQIGDKTFVFKYDSVSGAITPYKNSNDVEARLCLAKALLGAATPSQEQVGMAFDLLNTNFTLPHATELITKDSTTGKISSERLSVIQAEIDLAQSIADLSTVSPDVKVVQLKALSYLLMLRQAQTEYELQQNKLARQTPAGQPPIVTQKKATMAGAERLNELLSSVQGSKLALGQEEWVKLHRLMDSGAFQRVRNSILAWDPSAYTFLMSPEMVAARKQTVFGDVQNVADDITANQAIALLQELCCMRALNLSLHIADRVKTLLGKIGVDPHVLTLHLSPQYLDILYDSLREQDRADFILYFVDWEPKFCLSKLESWRKDTTHPNPHMADLQQFMKNTYATPNAKVEQLRVLHAFPSDENKARSLDVLKEIADGVNVNQIPTEKLTAVELPVLTGALETQIPLAKQLFAWEPSYLFHVLGSCLQNTSGIAEDQKLSAISTWTAFLNEKHFSVDAVVVQLRAYCYLQKLDPKSNMDRDEIAQALVEKLLESTTYKLTVDEEQKLKKIILSYNKELRAKLQHCCVSKGGIDRAVAGISKPSKEERPRIPREVLGNKQELSGFYTHVIRPALYGEPKPNPAAIPCRADEWKALSEFVEPDAFNKVVEIFLKEDPSLVANLLSMKMARKLFSKLTVEERERQVAYWLEFSKPAGKVTDHVARLQALFFAHSLNPQIDIMPIGQQLLREIVIHFPDFDLNNLKLLDFNDSNMKEIINSLLREDQDRLNITFVDINPEYFLPKIIEMGENKSIIPFVQHGYVSQNAKTLQIRRLVDLFEKKVIDKRVASERMHTLFQELATEVLRGNRPSVRVQFTADEVTRYRELLPPDAKSVIDIATSKVEVVHPPETSWESTIDKRDPEAKKELREIAQSWDIEKYVYCPEGVEPPPLPAGKEHQVQALIEKWECAKKSRLYPQPVPKGDPAYSDVVKTLTNLLTQVQERTDGFSPDEPTLVTCRDEILAKLETAQDKYSTANAQLMAFLTKSRTGPEALERPLPSLETLYVLYAQNNFDELERFGLATDLASVTTYKKMVSTLLSCTQEIQKANRVLGSVNEVLSAKTKDAFINAITKERGALDCARGMREYDPAVFPAFQVYEVFIDSLVTRKQFDNISQLMGEGNVLLQQLMGSGKTFILIPLLALAAADGDNIAIAMFPDPLLKTNLAEIQEKLGGAMRELVMEQPEINSSMSVSELHVLHELLLNVRQKRGVLFFSPEKMHILLNTQVNILEDLKAKKAHAKTLKERAKDVLVAQEDLKKLELEIKDIQAKLKEVTAILILLKEKGAVIGDEADELFKTSLQYIISVGDAESVSEGDAEMVGDLMFYIMEQKDAWSISLDFLKNSTSSPYLSFEHYGTEFLPKLRTTIIDKMKSNFRTTQTNLQALLLDTELKEKLVAYFNKDGFKSEPQKRKKIDDLFKTFPVAVREIIKKAVTEAPDTLISILNQYQEQVNQSIRVFETAEFAQYITEATGAYLSFNMRDGDSDPARAKAINAYIDTLPQELAQKMRDIRRVLFNTLHGALNTHCNEDHGITAEQKTLQASPFSGPQCLAKTQISSPFEKIIKSLEVLCYQGLNANQFDEMFSKMTTVEVLEFCKELNSVPGLPHSIEVLTAMSDKKAYLKTQLENVMACHKAMISPKKAASLLSNEVQQRKAFIAFSRKVVGTFLYPALDEHKESIVSNSQKLWYSFRKVSAFTGTLWNKSTQPTWRAIYPDDWTAGDFFMKLFRKSKKEPPEISTYNCGSKHAHIESLHNLIREQGANALMDNGGWLRDQDTMEAFARAVFKDREDITSVVVHGLDKKLYIYEREKEKPRLLSPKESKLMSPGQFTIYAKQYCVGTDIKQMPNALAIQTIGPGMTDRDWAQGASRMRQIAEGQRIVLAYSDEELETLQSTVGKSFSNVSVDRPTQGPQFLDWIRGFVSQEAEVRLGQNQQSTRERMKCQIEDKFRTLIGKKIMADRFDDVLLIYEKARDYFVTTRGKDEKEHIQFHAATKERMEQEIKEMMQKFTGASSGIEWEGMSTSDLEGILRSVIRYNDLPETMTEEDQKKDPVLDVGMQAITQAATAQEAVSQAREHVESRVKVEQGVVQQVEHSQQEASSGAQEADSSEQTQKLAGLAQQNILEAYERVRCIDEKSLANKPQLLAKVKEIKQQGELKKTLAAGEQHVGQLVQNSGCSSAVVAQFKALFDGTRSVTQAKDTCLKNICALPLENIQQMALKLQQKDVLGLAATVAEAVRVRLAVRAQAAEALLNTDEAQECHSTKEALDQAALEIANGVSDERLHELEDVVARGVEANRVRAQEKTALDQRRASMLSDMPSEFAAVRSVLDDVNTSTQNLADVQSALNDAQAMTTQLTELARQNTHLAEKAKTDTAFSEMLAQNRELASRVTREGLAEGVTQAHIDAHMKSVASLEEAVARRDAQHGAVQAHVTQQLQQQTDFDEFIKGGPLFAAYDSEHKMLTKAQGVLQQALARTTHNEAEVRAQAVAVEQAEKAFVAQQAIVDQKCTELMNAREARNVAIQGKRDGIERIEGKLSQKEGYSALKNMLSALKGQLAGKSIDDIEAAQKQAKKLLETYEALYQSQEALRKKGTAQEELRQKNEQLLQELDAKGVTFDEQLLKDFQAQQAHLTDSLQALNAAGAAIQEQLAHKQTQQSGLGILENTDAYRTYAAGCASYQTQAEALQEELGKKVHSQAEVDERAQNLERLRAAFVQQEALIAEQLEAVRAEAIAHAEDHTLADLQGLSETLSEKDALNLKGVIEQAIQRRTTAQERCDALYRAMDEAEDTRADKTRLPVLKTSIAEAQTKEALEAVLAEVEAIVSRDLALSTQKQALKGDITTQKLALEANKASYAGAYAVLEEAFTGVLSVSQLQTAIQQAQDLKAKYDMLNTHLATLETEKDTAFDQVREQAKGLQSQLNNKTTIGKKSLQDLEHAINKTRTSLADRAKQQEFALQQMAAVVSQLQVHDVLASMNSFNEYSTKYAELQQTRQQLEALVQATVHSADEVDKQSRDIRTLATQYAAQKSAVFEAQQAVRTEALSKIEQFSLLKLKQFAESESATQLGCKDAYMSAVTVREQRKAQLDETVQNTDDSPEMAETKVQLQALSTSIDAGGVTDAQLQNMETRLAEQTLLNQSREEQRTQLLGRMTALSDTLGSKSDQFAGVRNMLSVARANAKALGPTALEQSLREATERKALYDNVYAQNDSLLQQEDSAYTELKNTARDFIRKLDTQTDDTHEALTDELVSLAQQQEELAVTLSRREEQLVQSRAHAGAAVEELQVNSQINVQQHVQAREAVIQVQERIQQQINATPQSQAELDAQLFALRQLEGEYEAARLGVQQSKEAIKADALGKIESFTLAQLGEFAHSQLAQQLGVVDAFTQAVDVRTTMQTTLQTLQDDKDASEESVAKLGELREKVAQATAAADLVAMGQAVQAARVEIQARKQERETLTADMSTLNASAAELKGVHDTLSAALAHIQSQKHLNHAALKQTLEKATKLKAQYEGLAGQMQALSGKRGDAWQPVQNEAQDLRAQLDSGKLLSDTALTDLSNLSENLTVALQQRDEKKQAAVALANGAISEKAELLGIAHNEQYKNALAAHNQAKAAIDEAAKTSAVTLANVRQEADRFSQLAEAYKQCAAAHEAERMAYIEGIFTSEFTTLFSAIQKQKSVLAKAGELIRKDTRMEQYKQRVLENGGAHAQQVLQEMQNTLLAGITDTGALVAIRDSQSASTQLKHLADVRLDQFAIVHVTGDETVDAQLKKDRTQLVAQLNTSAVLDAAVVQAFKEKRDRCLGVAHQHTEFAKSLQQSTENDGSITKALVQSLQSDLKNLSQGEATEQTLADAARRFEEMKATLEALLAVTRKADSYFARLNQDQSSAKQQALVLSATLEQIRTNPQNATNLSAQLEAQYTEFDQVVAMHQAEQQLEKTTFGSLKVLQVLSGFVAAQEKVAGSREKAQALQEKLEAWWSTNCPAGMQTSAFAQTLHEKLMHMSKSTVQADVEVLKQGHAQLVQAEAKLRQAHAMQERLQAVQSKLQEASGSLGLTVECSVEKQTAALTALDAQFRTGATIENALTQCDALLAQEEQVKGQFIANFQRAVETEAQNTFTRNDATADALSLRAAKEAVYAQVGTAKEAIVRLDSRAIQNQVARLRTLATQYAATVEASIAGLSLEQILALPQAIVNGAFKEQIEARKQNRLLDRRTKFSSYVDGVKGRCSDAAVSDFVAQLDTLVGQLGQSQTVVAFERLHQQAQAIEASIEKYQQEKAQAEAQIAQLDGVQAYTDEGATTLQGGRTDLKAEMAAVITHHVEVGKDQFAQVVAHARAVRDQVQAQNQQALAQIKTALDALRPFAKAIGKEKIALHDSVRSVATKADFQSLQAAQQSYHESLRAAIAGLSLDEAWRVLETPMEEGFHRQVEARKNELIAQRRENLATHCQNKLGSERSRDIVERDLFKKIQEYQVKLAQAERTVDFDRLGTDLAELDQKVDQYESGKKAVQDALRGIPKLVSEKSTRLVQNVRDQLGTTEDIASLLKTLERAKMLDQQEKELNDIPKAISQRYKVQTVQGRNLQQQHNEALRNQYDRMKALFEREDQGIVEALTAFSAQVRQYDEEEKQVDAKRLEFLQRRVEGLHSSLTSWDTASAAAQQAKQVLVERIQGALSEQTRLLNTNHDLSNEEALSGIEGDIASAKQRVHDIDMLMQSVNDLPVIARPNLDLLDERFVAFDAHAKEEQKLRQQIGSKRWTSVEPTDVEAFRREVEKVRQVHQFVEADVVRLNEIFTFLDNAKGLFDQQMGTLSEEIRAVLRENWDSYVYQQLDAGVSLQNFWREGGNEKLTELHALARFDSPSFINKLLHVQSKVQYNEYVLTADEICQDCAQALHVKSERSDTLLVGEINKIKQRLLDELSKTSLTPAKYKQTPIVRNVLANFRSWRTKVLLSGEERTADSLLKSLASLNRLADNCGRAVVPFSFADFLWDHSSKKAFSKGQCLAEEAMILHEKAMTIERDLITYLRDKITNRVRNKAEKANLLDRLNQLSGIYFGIAENIGGKNGEAQGFPERVRSTMDDFMRQFNEIEAAQIQASNA